MTRKSRRPRATQTQLPLDMGLGRVLPQPRKPSPRIAEIAGTIFGTAVMLSLWIASN
jgi:hypothetical protein